MHFEVSIGLIRLTLEWILKWLNGLSYRIPGLCECDSSLQDLARPKLTFEISDDVKAFLIFSTFSINIFVHHTSKTLFSISVTSSPVTGFETSHRNWEISSVGNHVCQMAWSGPGCTNDHAQLNGTMLIFAISTNAARTAAREAFVGWHRQSGKVQWMTKRCPTDRILTGRWRRHHVEMILL